MNWFDVDHIGLAKLIEQRGKYRAVFELIQNAWDQKSTKVNVEIEPIPNKPFVNLIVTDDDPDGFSDLTHAFTLFAESTKKGNPEQRGRFNIGEKFVLALCNRASITTTTGTVVFNESGRRIRRGELHKTSAGSIFLGEMRMTREEYDQTIRMLQTLIPPIPTKINATDIPQRKPIVKFVATLPTEISDVEGFLRKTQRKTTMEIYETKPGEVASLYEMGIPVVETSDKYHVNIMQKVPLNTDRDNVTPSFLQLIRTLVVNNTYQLHAEEDANTAWVRAASSDDRCSTEAMSSIISQRFGPKRVIFDPSDPEANNKASSLGYTVIKGAQLNKQEWDNVRRDQLALPAGQVTPAKLEFSGVTSSIPDSELTPGMKDVRKYTVALAEALMGVELNVYFLNTSKSTLVAYYSRHSDKKAEFVFYIQPLGMKWFDINNNIEGIDQLIIHEFGHQYSSNHLSHDYHEALCKLGAKLKQLAVQRPEFFILR